MFRGAVKQVTKKFHESDIEQLSDSTFKARSDVSDPNQNVERRSHSKLTFT